MKFWKRKKDVVEDVDVVERKVSNYPIAVQQIHSEFMNSAEERLKLAMEFIEANRNLPIKSDRLSNLGFNSVPQVIETKELKRKIEIGKNEIDIIIKYRNKYPKNKFITESQVKIICEKYNLVCGSVGLFKGFVPEKNLTDIEKFTKKFKFNVWRTQISNKMLDMSAFTIKGGRNYEHFYDKWGDRHFQRNVGSDHFYSDGTVNGKTIRCSDGDGRLFEYGLQICAPIKDMNTSGYERRGHNLIKHIPDPIILQPIEGGYLIVTAWGDEASDELIVGI